MLNRRGGGGGGGPNNRVAVVFLKKIPLKNTKRAKNGPK